MVKCSECGRSVPEDIKFCPDCGQKILLETTGKSKRWLILTIILSVIVLSIIIGFAIYSGLTISKSEAESLALNKLKDFALAQGGTPTEVENIFELVYVDQSYKQNGVWYVIINVQGESESYTIKVYSKDKIILPENL